MRSPDHYAKVLRSQRHPIRFLAARALMKSGLSPFVRMQWHGFALRFYPSNLSGHIWVDREARWADSEFLRAWLSPGDVVVDVGANIGTTVLPSARIVGPTGRVIAVEAHPRLVRYLLGNLSENAITNVDVHWCALGEREGALGLTDSSADDRNSVSEDGELHVPLRTLDGLTTALPRIDVLKLDVEGYERLVFRGGARTLERTSCVVFESFEKHASRFGYSSADLIELLGQRGLSVFRWAGERRLVPVGPGHRSERCEDLVALRDPETPRGGFSIA